MKRVIERSPAERTGYALILILLCLVAFVMIYPFWHTLMYSLSDTKEVTKHTVLFYPILPSLEAYKLILSTKQIYVAYGNTIARTVLGTLLSLLLTATTAYPLAISRFRGRNFFSLMIYLTMLISGGMIPTYLLVNSLGMINTFWALIIPGSISAYNLFIMRNYFQSLPADLEASARIDGANAVQILFGVYLPISGPVIAALAMFYGISNWNSYMDCIIYTNDARLQVLQVYLREVMITNSASNAVTGFGADSATAAVNTVSDKSLLMTIVSVSVIPILLVYPFLQRYYTSGLTIGAVKG